jgi:hypothetical protein
VIGIVVAVAVAIGLEGWMQNAVADRIELEFEGMTATGEIGTSGVKGEVKVEDKKGVWGLQYDSDLRVAEIK